MAADAVVLESAAAESFDFSSSLFDPVPTDSTWIQQQLQAFYPVTSLNANSTEINFLLPELLANYSYKFYDALLSLKVKITKSDGLSKPNDGSKVALVNNMMYSLFNAVEVKLNDISLSANNECYNYKQYISTLLSYSNLTKNAELNAPGFYRDQAGMFNSIKNAGYVIIVLLHYPFKGAKVLYLKHAII
jgi:hypothetical protein